MKHGKNLFLIPLLLLLIVSLAVPGHAADEGWQAVGVRYGFSMTEKDEYFHQYEVYTEYGLPWHWRGASGWGVSTKFNLALGALYGGHTTSFVGSFGPSLAFDRNGRGFQFEIGPDFAVLGRDRFGKQNFGGLGLFQGHGSVSYIFDNGLGISYRAQHTSNGGMYGPGNPGYDLHMFGVSWHFL
ncbi:acyloxyacyl hydrolase [Geomonas sp. RF6]|uniref:acyloxyacyl hydrolase n=1 Tax=Geomonas sp. RF6 TaxID=2897342 RepID=UPI001E28A5FA|nr:acyloxyacyl hydrolase [Geomonas sp. RF6]UFS70029.1 acyloxyacyl hydrolase [Geomonas sp. RF6]